MTLLWLVLKLVVVFDCGFSALDDFLALYLIIRFPVFLMFLIFKL